MSGQVITPGRLCGLVTVEMMADRSSMIGLGREFDRICQV